MTTTAQDLKTRIHLPNTKQKKVPEQPVIFLAGPIRNAPMWHSDAIKHFITNNVDAFIASPSRTVVPELEPVVEPSDESAERFHRQRAWERYYLDLAANEGGVIIFWLPTEELPKANPDKVYGHITQMELARWVFEAKLNPSIKLVIGSGGGYPEWDTVRFDIGEDLPELKFCSSIQECCDQAIAILKQQEEEGHLMKKRLRPYSIFVKTLVSVDEFIAKMKKKKPSKVFNTGYSRKKHLYELGDYAEDGAMCLCTNSTKKSFVFKTWEELHKQFSNGETDRYSYLFE